MDYLRRRTVFASVALLLIASSVSPQQRSMAVFSASGTTEATLKVQAFENDRHFVIHAIGDAAVIKGQTRANFSIEIKVTDDDPSAKNFIAYGCEEKNTAKFDDGIGRLHVETSCEIVVTAKKMVAVTAKVDSRSSGAKPENITLEATSSW